MRDNTPTPVRRMQFSPSMLPAYLSRTDAIEELITFLYLKGISTGDFGEALQSPTRPIAAGNQLLTTSHYSECCRYELLSRTDQSHI